MAEPHLNDNSTNRAIQPAAGEGYRSTPTQGETPPQATDPVEERNAELAWSLTILRAAIEALDEGVLVTGCERQVVATNQRFESFWSLTDTPEERTGSGALFQEISRQLQESDEFLAHIDEVLNTDSPESQTHSHTLDGRAIELRSRTQDLDQCKKIRVWSFRDVTTHQREKRHFEEVSEQLRVTLASIGDAVLTTDIVGCVTSMNAVAESLTGWSEREAIGRHSTEVLKIIHEVTRQPVESPIEQALRMGRIVLLANQSILLARDGREWPIDDSAAPIRDAKQRLLGAVLIFRDVSARRSSEERLRQSEARLNDFFENATIALHWLAPDGRILRVNQAELDLMGYSREELLGRNIAEFHVDPSVVVEILRRLAAGETVRNVEARLRRKDGAVRNVVIDSSGYWLDGRFVHSRCFTRDITEQRRVEFSLREHESQLRIVTDNAPVMLARCSRDLRFRYVNQRYATRFGVEPEALVNVSIAEVVGEAVMERVRPEIEQVLAGKRVSFDRHIDYPGLGKRYMRCVYEPDWDVTGRVVQGWFAVIHDITDQREAEETKALLSSIVTSSQDVIVSKSLNGEVLSWNSAAEQLFGYRAEEMVGQSINVIVPPELRDEEATLLRRLAAGERIAHFETQRITRNGRRVTMSLSISPLRDSHHRIVGASKIARDVTSHRRAELSGKFLADASESLSELSNPDVTFQRIAELAVPTFADLCVVHFRDDQNEIRLVGASHVDPSQLSIVLALHERFSSADWQAGPFQVFETGQPELIPLASEEFFATITDDPVQLELIRQLELRSYLCVPMKQRGKVVGVLSFASSLSCREFDHMDLHVAEDLAQRAAVAIENANLVAALREADHRKDDFLATLGHELRNPLAPICNALNVLRLSHSLAPETRELCEVMEEQANYLVRLVDDLLEVSRISRGKIDLRKENIELTTIILSAVEIVRPMIEDHQHSLEVHVPGEPVYIHADPVRLSQVVTNLLTNAAKYMEPGGSVQISGTADAESAMISVRDTGLGIPPEMLPRVFEMFTQVEHTRQRSQGGLGIGLALARTLVELHGGRIEAHSDGIGAGSEFVIHLPRVPGPQDLSRQADTKASQPLPRYRILVVDDTRAALFVLDKLLTAMGQDVQTCKTGTAALEAARQSRPDVVISDIGMPDMDGYELARLLRSDPSLGDVVLVALTGYGQIRDRERTRAAGFDHHLIKPVGVDELQELLRELTDSRRSGVRVPPLPPRGNS